jgi:hypothetical protein
MKWFGRRSQSEAYAVSIYDHLFLIHSVQEKVLQSSKTYLEIMLASHIMKLLITKELFLMHYTSVRVNVYVCMYV